MQKDGLGFMKKTGDPNLNESHRIGIAFWRVGNIKRQNITSITIKYCEATLKHKRSYPQYGGAYYDLAATYAFLVTRQSI